MVWIRAPDESLVKSVFEARSMGKRRRGWSRQIWIKEVNSATEARGKKRQSGKN